ncbi:hypothetical protein Moror_14521 [Moniliophthora roreri MCA 2997]|uniref:F-box domain-containing protein n=1 Tax=Moniliophthora roreri (strain MCA 2997) TaxID=1381753 RepID=V2XLF1_MONRO|nr:hypothetical protein Moror_14521 [Moniliophthora roreri MCA 2997]
MPSNSNRTRISSLPPETLLHIFGFSVEKNVFGPPSISRSDSSKLGAVCSLWRSLSLSTPKVWTKISVFVSSMPLPSSTVVSALKRHIELSKNAPLELGVEWRVFGGTSNPLLEILQAHASRWSHLSCKINGNVTGSIVDINSNHRFYSFALPGLPFLRSLDIEATNLDCSAFEKLLECTSPQKLQALHLSALDHFLPPKTTQLIARSLNHITHVMMQVTSTAALTVLNACPNLISAHFSIPSSVESHYFFREAYADLYDEDDSDPEDDRADDMDEQLLRWTLRDSGSQGDIHEWRMAQRELENRLNKNFPLCLSHLRSLTLRVPDSSDAWRRMPFWAVCRILNALTCPSLTSFALIANATKDEETHDDGFTSEKDAGASLVPALEWFFNKSGIAATLQSLALHSIPLRETQLIELLEMTSYLTELNISEAADIDHESFCWSIKESKDITGTVLMKRMVLSKGCPESTNGNDSARMLLPRLRQLALTVNKDWQDHAFEDMLESRFSSGSTDGLQSVFLRVLDIEYLDLERLKKLQLSGLAIRVMDGQQSEEILGYS